jgi:hypothetical protein
MTDRQLKEVLAAEVLALTQLKERLAQLKERLERSKERLERSKERLDLVELWATGHGYQNPDWPSHSESQS